MKQTINQVAEKYLKRPYDSLAERERQVLEKIQRHVPISRNVNAELEQRLTFGQRVADRVAKFGGSWTFIIIFGVILATWILINSVVLIRGDRFDPYPYILLNLVLSMVAAMQAPIIMMSQNRQSQHDRIDASNDYQVNLKSELEIRRLHDKIDELREEQWSDLVKMQQEQIVMLTDLVERLRPEATSNGAAE